MKTLHALVFALVAILAFADPALGQNPGPKQRKGDRNVVLHGDKNELQAGSNLYLNGDVLIGDTEVGVPFVATATVTSTTSATATSLLPATAVPTGKKVYVTGFVAKVNGATAWTTTSTVKIQDTNSSAVDFFTIAVAALTGNAELRPGTSNVTSENAYVLGSGSTAAKGLQVKANANAGAGSNLVVTVWGIIK